MVKRFCTIWSSKLGDSIDKSLMKLSSPSETRLWVSCEDKPCVPLSTYLPIMRIHCWQLEMAEDQLLWELGIYNSVKLTQGADIHVNNGACYSSNGSGFSSGKSLDGDMNKKLCEKTKATDCACLLCQKTPPRGHPFRLHNLLPLNNETSCCRKGTLL